MFNPFENMQAFMQQFQLFQQQMQGKEILSSLFRIC